MGACGSGFWGPGSRISPLLRRPNRRVDHRQPNSGQTFTIPRIHAFRPGTKPPPIPIAFSIAPVETDNFDNGHPISCLHPSSPLDIAPPFAERTIGKTTFGLSVSARLSAHPILFSPLSSLLGSITPHPSKTGLDPPPLASFNHPRPVSSFPTRHFLSFVVDPFFPNPVFDSDNTGFVILVSVWSLVSAAAVDLNQL